MQNEFSTDHCYPPLQAADKVMEEKYKTFLKVSCCFFGFLYKDRNFFMGQSIKPYHVSQAMSVSQSQIHNKYYGKNLSKKDMFFVNSKSNLSDIKQGHSAVKHVLK